MQDISPVKQDYQYHREGQDSLSKSLAYVFICLTSPAAGTFAGHPSEHWWSSRTCPQLTAASRDRHGKAAWWASSSRVNRQWCLQWLQDALGNEFQD